MSMVPTADLTAALRAEPDAQRLYALGLELAGLALSVLGEPVPVLQEGEAILEDFAAIAEAAAAQAAELRGHLRGGDGHWAWVPSRLTPEQALTLSVIVRALRGRDRETLARALEVAREPAALRGQEGTKP